MVRLILGSASPRRAELLAQIGVVPHEIRPADIDETPLPGELPRDYCKRITRAKVEAIAPGPDEAVLCADTTVALGRRILGKPENRDEAHRFLTMLGGRRHRVITALALRTPERTWERDSVTALKMRRLSPPELADYLAGNEWQGKAGGYAIQGRAGAFIPWLQGSYTGVVGLPLSETAQLLRHAGVLR